METFTVAMTVLMAISALVQLVVSIATLSASKRMAIKNWIAWRVDLFMVILMAAIGAWGLWKFALTEAPQKWDYYMMAASAACLAMAFAAFLSCILVRHFSTLSLRMNQLELAVFDSSKPSNEGVDG